MKHGCTVALAAVAVTACGFATAAAECNPRNPTACTSDSRQKSAPEPQAAAPQSQPKTAAPLQLKRFIKNGPARRSGSDTRRASRTPAIPAEPVREAEAVHEAENTPATPAAANETALAPKAVPTLSISAAALAVKPPGQDHTIGFGASTEPWAPENAFASADDAAAVALPPGITIVRSDEVNEIDLAADAEAKTLADNTVGVSLITPARAAPPPEPEEPQPQASWLSWAYGKLVDGVLAAVLAVRSVFV